MWSRIPTPAVSTSRLWRCTTTMKSGVPDRAPRKPRAQSNIHSGAERRTHPTLIPTGALRPWEGGPILKLMFVQIRCGNLRCKGNRATEPSADLDLNEQLAWHARTCLKTAFPSVFGCCKGRALCVWGRRLSMDGRSTRRFTSTAFKDKRVRWRTQKQCLSCPRVQPSS